ncbi:MAG: hypothetical protein AB7F88_13540 [Pyrinomonadaceae bacterium]
MTRAVTILILVITLVSFAFAQKRPVVEELTAVSQVPPEIPQRITGLAFDGERLWFSVYPSRGRYATFNMKTEEWRYSDDETHHVALRQVSQPFSSVGGIAFAGRSLWVGGSFGESLGSINLDTWQVEKHFRGKRRPDVHNSQSYSSLAFDGTNLWAAWHMFEYKRPASESQQLLKIDRETGEVLEIFPLPAGTRADGVHGLTFDGETLWHIKDKKLSAIDLHGRVLAQFSLKNVCRPSGLAWDGQFLWIVEFSGKLWKLPIR